MSLKNKTITGVLWSAIERFSVQGIQFVLGIFIARLVLPSDYGLMAMLGVFLAIAQVFIDSGFSVALIQKQNRTEIDYSTVFYFNIVVSFVVYALLYCGASSIASFYNEPDLERITKIIGLNLIINSLVVVQRAILVIELNFKYQAFTSLVAVSISGVIGFGMAYMGYGIWALIVQTMLNNIIIALLLWYFSGWFPSLCFSWKSFHYLFGFGSKLLMAGLLHTAYLNMYTLVIGKFFSSTELGYYGRANSFTGMVSGNIPEMLNRVIYPVQCSMQHDDERFRTSSLLFIRMSCFVVFPIMVGLCVLAKPLVIFVLTDKWLYVAELLPILCLAYIWDILMRINFNILSAKRKSHYILKSEILKKITAIIILIITIPWGIKIMCWGIVIYSLIDLCIVTYYTQKTIAIGFWSEMCVLFPIIVLTSSMGILVLLVTSFCKLPVTQLCVGICIGGGYYVSAAYLFRFKEFSIIKDLLKRKI